MKEWFVVYLVGLLLGFVTTPITVTAYADLSVSNIRAAEAVCIQANSELVSLDRRTATCKNRAEIPYEVEILK